MNNVLFLCRTNSCLSLLAEAYMSVAGRGLWRVWSAGIEPSEEVDPRLIDFLRRAGVRKSNLYCKSWRAFAVHGAPPIDLAVLLTADRPLSWPPLPGQAERMTWSVASPGEAAGGPEAARQGMLEAFADIRRHIDSLLLGRSGVEQRIA